jgi:hypothetical protein
MLRLLLHPTAVLLALAVTSACGRLGYSELDLPIVDRSPDGSVDADAGSQEPVPNEPRPPFADGGANDAGLADSSVEPLPPEVDASLPFPDAGSSDASQPSGAPDAGSPDAGPGAEDAGVPATDAGASPDGGNPVPDASVPRACGGVRYSDVCWYLGGGGESCRDACRGRGGIDPRAPTIVGSPAQGGSLQECSDIFALLGFRSRVNQGYRPDRIALGCHRWEDGVLWWLDDPGFDASALASPAAMVCGCLD